MKVNADFSIIRYAQCWEDADILLEALDIQPDHLCLSIASAGDNTLAMLSRGPERVIALDLSPAQLACLELRIAAYRELEYSELLELIGSRPSRRRDILYQRCQSQLSSDVRRFWDSRSDEIPLGIGSIGKFERYLAMFRNCLLPLIHSRDHIAHLLKSGTFEERGAFYSKEWDNRRWRLLFKIFFSRFVMGRLGRDPSFFNYVEGGVADCILERTRYALSVLDPVQNPYLQWILAGYHMTALPYALRPENFESIRNNLEHLEWRCQSIEDFLSGQDTQGIDRFNLSDIFEYMSLENYHRLLERIVHVGRRGGRLAYWNMLAPRHRPESLAGQLSSLGDLAHHLHLQDKAFFYSDFVVEEIV
ncbi:MAG: DUF3419 family protein [Candidatus Tectomicrobia bacterium]|nr:DUF3419 family protein [Candidatus Tectomicrobia bacterium]